jgi:hypothetical protein
MAWTKRFLDCLYCPMRSVPLRDGVSILHGTRQMLVIYANRVHLLSYEQGVRSSKAAYRANPSLFSSCSFGGGSGDGNGSAPVLQNLQHLPLEHEFTFFRVQREAQLVLEAEVRRLDDGRSESDEDDDLPIFKV